jgi:rhodanese-related sulfurtransferase
MSNDEATFDDVVPPISPEAAKTLIGRGDAIVIDVREAHEVARTGKVAGALHVPLGLLPLHEFDRGKALLLYCAVGERSELGGRTLKSLGYRNVFNLGGFRDWVKSGGAVDKA